MPKFNSIKDVIEYLNMRRKECQNYLDGRDEIVILVSGQVYGIDLAIKALEILENSKKLD